MRKHILSLATLLAFTLFVGMRSPASATIIDVPGDVSTIQGGINAAVNGDTVLIAQGTYFERNVSFGGKRIIVASSNPFDSVTVATTVVDYNGLGKLDSALMNKMRYHEQILSTVEHYAYNIEPPSKSQDCVGGDERKQNLR